MATTINADAVLGGYIVTADASGTLALQASGNTALTINPQRALGVGQTPSYGTAGQVLTSQGSATAPTWVSASSFPIGTIISSNTVPTSGTWLETGKYYSKSTYPALATAIGDIPDLGTPQVPSKLNSNGALSNAGVGFIGTSAIDCYATNGTVTVFASDGSGITVTSNGTDWKIVPSLGITGIYDVKYLNGKFFVVGDIALGVSSDGYTWDVITPPGISFRSIAYGAGKYVLTVSSSSVLTSTDLVTWTRILADTVTTTNIYHKIIFVNGYFVAITLTGKHVYSADGTTWTIPTFNQNFRDIAFGNGVWVGINIQGSSVIAYTSSNLTSWTTVSSVTGWLAGHAASKIKFLNGYFYIVCAEYTARSADGITWTFPRLNLSDYTAPNMNDMVWNGTYLVAAGDQGVYSTSTDGVTWTGKRAGISPDFKQLAVANNVTTGYYCLFNNTTATFDRPIIGRANWGYSSAGVFPTLYHRAVAYNGTNTYIYAGTNNIYKSSDGETWQPVHSLKIPLNASTSNWVRVRYVNGVFFVFGINDSAGMVYSTDNGVTWLRPAGLAATGKYLSDIAFGNGYWVLTTSNSSCFYATSLSGTWTAFLTANGVLFGDVVYFNNQFVIGGQLGVFYGMPGGTWTTVTLTGGTNLVYMRLFTANNILLALPTSDTSGNAATTATWIYTSTDATTWTQRTGLSSSARTNVAWNGTTFCMSGSGSLETSTDGITWTSRYTNIGSRSYTLGGVAAIGSNFVVSGPSSTNSPLLVSTDNGANWKIRSINASTAVNYVGAEGTKAFIHHTIYGLFSSTDGLSWKINNNYTTQTIQNSNYEVRMVKLGGKYFLLADTTHQSSDGVNWSPILSLPYDGTGGRATRIAYNGTYWLAVVESFTLQSPLTVFKSTDGINWTYLSNPINLFLHTTATLVNCVPSLVYANGEFLLGLTTKNSNLSQFNYLYASTDGVTWSPRSTPSALPVGDMDTDGTTVVITNTVNMGSSGFNFSGVFKTTDNGLTWQTISLGSMHNNTGSSNITRVLYLSSNSTWIIGGYKTTDLTNFTTITASNNRLTSTYWIAAGEYIISFEANTSIGNYVYATLHNKNTNYSYPLVIEGKGTLLGLNNNGQTEVFTNTNGDVLLPPYNNVLAYQPANFIEIPLYSYNTTTTFWVPPSYGSGKKEYIYAGA